MDTASDSLPTHASNSNVTPLGKHLASTDKATRDKAVKALNAFLSGPSRVYEDEKEMAKLWKGLFYCFWMSDKPLIQQALAAEMAGIMSNIESVDSALIFLEGFWRCIVREWTGIDRLRTDKFYMLIRRYVNASFQVLMRCKWDAKYMERYNSILARQGGPLCPTDTRVPQSLAYHLCDIYLEELEKALATVAIREKQLTPVPIALLIGPFLALAARTATTHTIQRVTSTLITPLLDALIPQQSLEIPGQKRRRPLDQDFSVLIDHACMHDPTVEHELNATALHAGICKLVWATACDLNSRDSNRRRLYKFWKQHALDLDDEADSSIARVDMQAK